MAPSNGADYLATSVEEPLAASEGDAAPCARSSKAAWLRVPKRLGWVAGVALGVAAASALALRLSRRPAAEGEALPPALQAKDLVGLEELHPALVERLIHPDREADVAELRRIGLDHPAVLKSMFDEYEMKMSLEDLRQLMAYQRRMMANASSVEEAISLQGTAVAGPPVVGPTKKVWMGNDVANFKCGFHVAQTVLYLTEAALAINDAARDCPQIRKTGVAQQGRRAGKDARVVCAIDIMAIFAGFGWTSFFIAALTAQCDATGTTDKASAECADDVTAIVAALMDLGESATSVGIDCKWAGLKQAAINLKMKRLKSKAKGAPQSEIGWCVLDPLQASYWLMRAAMFIHAATKDCGNEWESCSIDALYVVSSFNWAAGFLATAASDCAPEMNTKAQCAGDIVDLVAATTMVSAQGIAFKEGGCSVFGSESARHPGGGVR